MRTRRVLLGIVIAVLTFLPTGSGAASAGGDVLAYGAPDHGSTEGVVLNAPVVGLAAAPDGSGYWEVASDGGVFAFGGAHYAGSLGDIHLNRPIIGMAPTPSGLGYWLVASDGGVFTFGDAAYLGSLGGQGHDDIGGIVAAPVG
jgi:hypothetical protein